MQDKPARRQRRFGLAERARRVRLRRQQPKQRIAAFRETIADVHEGRFPERCHLVEMEAPFLDEVVCAIGGAPSNKKDWAWS